MKIWKLAFIAAVAGFLHGFILQQSPLTTLRQVTLHVSQAVDSVARCSGGALQQCVAAMLNHSFSTGTTRLPRLPPVRSEASEYTTLEERRSKPGQWIQTEKAESGLPGIYLSRGLLSIDVENMSLLRLVEDIGQRCRIDISGRHVLSDKVVSARLNNVQVEDGIRQLMRIASIKNYAVSYRNDLEGQLAVSQIVLLPEENEISDDYYLAKAGQEAD